MKKVAIVQGSKSDNAYGDATAQVLDEHGVPYDRFVISAHRDPEKLEEFCRTAGEKYLSLIHI